MQYGICTLSIIPLKLEPSDSSEMISQVLYGEVFKVLEQRAKWSRVRLQLDSCEGWIDNKQFLLVQEEIYEASEKETPILSADLIEFISDEKQNLMPVPLGSLLNQMELLKHHFEGQKIYGRKLKDNIVPTAFLYLNAPYLWGGKTPFGIDSSGLAQMVYRINGYRLHRNAAQQVAQGESLSFIEECEPGDLAFFDNKEGVIEHVGIMMKDNYIIHVHGKVRVDRIDHSGIYNADLGRHTHQLRVIKKII